MTLPFNHSTDDDAFTEECAVFGIIGTQDAAADTVLGLHALQHRGQEASGIFTSDGETLHQYKAFGKVGDNFSTQSVIDQIPGFAAIGHNRYSTSGRGKVANIQPLYAELKYGDIALAHNGNLTNARLLKKELVNDGRIFATSMDTEVFIHLIARSTQPTLEAAVVEAAQQTKGAFSMVILTKDSLIGVRDPNGVRPLQLGKLGDVHVLASESCAFDIIGADHVREVLPGEMVIIQKDGTIKSTMPFEKAPHKFCIFEYVYFSRPDSVIENRHVYSIRKEMGKQLALENPVDTDVVIPVPDSGVPSAIGYAEAANVPFELGIIRNHYVGRTFIEPTDQIRHLGVKLKHNANSAVIKGKRIVLIDDSIVRGTTSKKIVQMMRDAGAKEVHMRISSPPTTHSCFYGVDTPSREKLLAHKMTVDEMAKFIGADSLAFVSIDGLYKAAGEAKRNAEMPQFCDACFTGEYPIALDDENADNVSSLPSVSRKVKEA